MSRMKNELPLVAVSASPLPLVVLLVASGLMALAWQQWQSDLIDHQKRQPSGIQTVDFPLSTPDSRFLSQGWAEEAAALEILPDDDTEVPSDLLTQSAFHMQQAWQFYRQALLKRPLCVDCQYRLAWASALLELLFSPHPDPLPAGEREPEERNGQERTAPILAGFQRTFTLAPPWADLWEETGIFFVQYWPTLNETDRHFVITCLERALALAPERTEAVLAAALMADPDLPIVLSGADPYRVFAAARLYQRHGDTERARRQAQEVVARLQEEVSRTENAPSALLLLAEVQLFLGNQEEAREAYEQGLARTTDPAVRRDFCWRLAAWHFDRQDFVIARDYYRRYLALAPGSPEAVLQLGISSLRAGDREDGLRWLERAAGMRRGDVSWQTQLARLFQEAGGYDRANELYRRLLAHEQQPRPDLLLPLARNYKQLGLGQEALAAYRRLLAIDTNNAEAQAFIELIEGTPDKQRSDAITQQTQRTQ